MDPAAKRCRIEHCSILHDEQIDKMAELGLSPSFLIGHVHYWGKAFVEDIFGLEKASKLDRTGACEDQGIRWSLHSDDPVTEMNPLRCMENAVVRNMWRSDEPFPEERVPAAAALRAMTIDAAWQCHSDHEGSLETVSRRFCCIGGRPLLRRRRLWEGSKRKLGLAVAEFSRLTVRAAFAVVREILGRASRWFLSGGLKL